MSVSSSSEPVTLAGTVSDALGAADPPSEIHPLLPDCDTSSEKTLSTVKPPRENVTVDAEQDTDTVGDAKAGEARNSMVAVTKVNFFIVIS